MTTYKAIYGKTKQGNVPKVLPSCNKHRAFWHSKVCVLSTRYVQVFYTLLKINNHSFYIHHEPTVLWNRDTLLSVRDMYTLETYMKFRWKSGSGGF